MFQLLAHTTESIAERLEAIQEAVTDLKSQVLKVKPSNTPSTAPSDSESTGVCFSTLTLGAFLCYIDISFQQKLGDSVV